MKYFLCLWIMLWGFAIQISVAQGRGTFSEKRPFKMVDGICVYKEVDIKPKFKGNFNAFLVDKLHYPNDSAIDVSQNLSAMVQFVVYVDGTIGNFKAIGTYPDSWLSNELIAILKLTTGMWHVAWKDRKVVDAFCIMPLRVHIN